MNITQRLTLHWSVKESVYKWWGSMAVDFKKHIAIKSISGDMNEGIVHCIFKKETDLNVHYLFFNNNFLTWVLSDH
jgi:4'-phosphopantetheinyl transferase superfamily